MRADLVVVSPETVELSLQLGQVARAALFGQVLFQRLVEALDFALGLWVVGLAVPLGDPESPEQGLHGAAATPALRGENGPVVGEHRRR